MSSEDYVPINIDVHHVTSRAIQARCGDNVIRWIPRSLVYGPHETNIGKAVGQLVQIRVFRWFAEKNAIPLARK